MADSNENDSSSKKARFGKFKSKLSSLKNDVNQKIDSNEKLSNIKTKSVVKYQSLKQKKDNLSTSNNNNETSDSQQNSSDSESSNKNNEKLSNLKHQMSGNLDKSKEKYNTMKQDINEKKESKLHTMKNSMKNKMTSFKNRFEMQGLLKQARISLENWLNKIGESKDSKLKDLPFACGIAIVTTVSASLLEGGNLAMGVIFYRLDEGYETDENENPIQRWSQPCAIGCLAYSYGLAYGIAKYDHIIIFKNPKLMEKFASLVLILSFCFVCAVFVSAVSDLFFGSGFLSNYCLLFFCHCKLLLFKDFLGSIYFHFFLISHCIKT